MCDRELLENENSVAQMHMSFSTHIFTFFEKSVRYAHFYVFELWSGLWHRYTTSRDCTPNETIKVYKFLRDWRGRCFPTNGFSDQRWYCETQHCNIEAPILQCSEVALDDGSVIFDVSGSIFLISPVEASYTEKFHSGTAGIGRCVMSWSAMGIIGVTGRKESAADDTSHTTEEIGYVVQACATLQERFKQKCNEALTSRK